MVIDQTIDNKASLMAEKSNGHEVFVNESTKPATYVIAAMIEDKGIHDLHLHVDTRPGAMLFRSGVLNLSTIPEHLAFLEQWKQGIRGRVIVYSNTVFEGEAGQSFKQALEHTTGLLFEMQ